MAKDTSGPAFPVGVFEMHGDERLTEHCATEGCGGQVMYRQEAGGVGAYYCSGCARRIADAMLAEDARDG